MAYKGVKWLASCLVIFDSPNLKDQACIYSYINWRQPSNSSFLHKAEEMHTDDLNKNHPSTTYCAKKDKTKLLRNALSLMQMVLLWTAKWNQNLIKIDLQFMPFYSIDIIMQNCINRTWYCKIIYALQIMELWNSSK